MSWPTNTASTVPAARNGPNGSVVLRPAPAHGHGDHADHGAQQEAEEQPDRHDARVQVAQVHAEQRRQANVAVAHAATTGYVDQPMIASAMPAPSAACQMRSGSSFTSAATTSTGALSADRGVRDLAGQPLRVQVDPDQRDQRRAHDAERDQRDVGAELQTEQHEQRRRCDLDDQRFGADRSCRSGGTSRAGPTNSRSAPDRVPSVGCRTRHTRSAAATTDPPRGTRSTTTVRNEPINNPITAQAIKNQCRFHLVSTLGPMGRRGREL